MAEEEVPPQDISEIFDLMDVDDDGFLDQSEVGRFIRLAKLEATDDDINALIEELDPDKIGKIKKEVFVEALTAKAQEFQEGREKKVFCKECGDGCDQ